MRGVGGGRVGGVRGEVLLLEGRGEMTLSLEGVGGQVGRRVCLPHAGQELGQGVAEGTEVIVLALQKFNQIK